MKTFASATGIIISVTVFVGAAQADNIVTGRPYNPPVPQTNKIQADKPSTGSTQLDGVRNPSAPFEPVQVTFPDKKRSATTVMRVARPQPVMQVQGLRVMTAARPMPSRRR